MPPGKSRKSSSKSGSMGQFFTSMFTGSTLNGSANDGVVVRVHSTPRSVTASVLRAGGSSAASGCNSYRGGLACAVDA